MVEDLVVEGGMYMKKRMMHLIPILLISLLLQGCPASKDSDKSGNGKSDNEVTEKMDNSADEDEGSEGGKAAEDTAEAIDCVLMVKVNYESNVVMAKYSIIVKLDGEEIATVANGKEYFGSFDVKSGQHELTFEKNGDPDISNSYSFKVESNCTAYCSLKSHMDYIEITEKNATGEAVCPDDQHQWEEATCKSPKTCKVCGITEGGLAEHTPGSWQSTKPASCVEEGEESTVCAVCGETITRKVDKIDHNVTEWEVVKEATCSEQGEEKGVCSVCGQEMTRPVDKIPHEPNEEWSVEKEATFSDKGTRVKKCKVCDEVVEREEYELSEEERLKWLKNNCESGLYEKISRDPAQYMDAYVKFSGEVIQVCSEAKSASEYSTYRVATKNGYDDVILIAVLNYGKSRILEGDKITVYGQFADLYTYESVMGASITIPLVYVLEYE